MGAGASAASLSHEEQLEVYEVSFQLQQYLLLTSVGFCCTLSAFLSSKTKNGGCLACAEISRALFRVAHTQKMRRYLEEKSIDDMTESQRQLYDELHSQFSHFAADVRTGSSSNESSCRSADSKEVKIKQSLPLEHLTSHLS
jgi:hypothetical protein